MMVHVMFFVTLAAGAAGSPAVPPNIDPAVYRTKGDDRRVLELHATAHYNCTYPNDPKTMKDVSASARARAESGHHDPINIPANQCDIGYNCEVICDSCDTGFQESFAWFCGEVNGSKHLNRARASYYGSPRNPPTTGCTQYANSDWFQTIQLGVEHGTFVERGNPGPSACSVHQPAHHCVPHQPVFSGPICICDFDTCKTLGGAAGCCKWEQTTEAISAEFKWYEFESSTLV